MTDHKSDEKSKHLNPSPRAPLLTIIKQRSARRLAEEKESQTTNTPRKNAAEDKKKLAELTNAIKTYSKINIGQYIECHIARGDFFLDMEQDDQALKDFQTALSNCKPNTFAYAKILNLIGVTLLLSGEKIQALKAFDMVNKIDPKQLTDLNQRPDLLTQQALATELITLYIPEMDSQYQPTLRP